MRDFNHTVDVLVKAYLNDTLIQGSPCGCAIGNLIAHSLGKKVQITDAREFEGNWDGDVATPYDWFGVLRPGRLSGITLNTIDKKNGAFQLSIIGYSVIEIGRIESAFEEHEGSFYNYNTDSSRFDGLMRVVDVLAEIHGIDLTAKEEAKLLFVKV